MQVTKDGIERIKAANELCSVVADRGIELRKKGRVAVARCPFHEERTASFTVTPSRGLFHCFGCGAAGDVIGFVTKYDKVTFGAALDVLARPKISGSLFIESTTSGSREKISFFKVKTWVCGVM